MSMTGNIFETLSQDARMEYLYRYGTYLAAYREGKMVFMLYRSSDGFYMELEYDQNSNQIIDTNHITEDSWKFQAYIDLIKIGEP